MRSNLEDWPGWLGWSTMSPSGRAREGLPSISAEVGLMEKTQAVKHGCLQLRRVSFCLFVCICVCRSDLSQQLEWWCVERRVLKVQLPIEPEHLQLYLHTNWRLVGATFNYKVAVFALLPFSNISCNTIVFQVEANAYSIFSTCAVTP